MPGEISPVLAVRESPLLKELSFSVMPLLMVRVGYCILPHTKPQAVMVFPPVCSSVAERSKVFVVPCRFAVGVLMDRGRGVTWMAAVSVAVFPAMSVTVTVADLSPGVAAIFSVFAHSILSMPLASLALRAAVRAPSTSSSEVSSSTVISPQVTSGGVLSMLVTVTVYTPSNGSPFRRYVYGNV